MSIEFIVEPSTTTVKSRITYVFDTKSKDTIDGLVAKYQMAPLFDWDTVEIETDEDDEGLRDD